VSPLSQFRTLLIREYHEKPTRGHAGFVKTLQSLAANLFWKIWSLKSNSSSASALFAKFWVLYWVDCILLKKQEVLERCWTICPRHLSTTPGEVLCFAFLKDLIFTWDLWGFDWRYDSRDLFSKRRVFLKVVYVGLCFVVFSKLNVQNI